MALDVQAFGILVDRYDFAHGHDSTSQGVK
jgi:hypothetical protein